MNLNEQNALHDKINTIQYLSEEEQKQIHDQIDTLVCNSNGWETIDKLFKEEKDLQKYYIEARNEAWRDNCQSYPIIMVMTIEKLIEEADRYRELKEGN